MNRNKKITIQSSVTLLLSQTIIFKGQPSQKLCITFWDTCPSKRCFRMEKRTGSQALQGTTTKLMSLVISEYE